VDFGIRAELLGRLESGWLPAVDASGVAKLHLVRTVLRLRRKRPELFTGYRPVHAEGSAAGHALAFGRGPGLELVAVATRLPVGLARAGGWGDTVLPLPPGPWVDQLTGQIVHSGLMAELLDTYPVALLMRES
jgi:(1->4)-alpha-D-glucan 1-alpha-D-glucosylmutase